MRKDRPELIPAIEKLLDLAEETAPDIDRQDLHGAITACTTAGWPWWRVLSETVQMLCRGETPRDLRTAARTPGVHVR